MCGLAGFLSSEAADARDILGRMTGALLHRGPDSGGLWHDPAAGIALGHRRLAIVDLTEAGQQPMASASGRFHLVYNGEIYNHGLLRAELEAVGAGSDWRGHSDTETLLAAIEHWGLAGALRRCIGMFSIALWDRTEQRLFLARDRFGEKPMYYGWQGDGARRAFLFGSELKALRCHPSFEAALNRTALAQLARYNYIPAPLTVYQGIHKLPPASFLTVSSRDPQVRTETYWSAAEVALAGAGARSILSDDEAVNGLEARLRTAIRQQMLADVPLGAFLSGGIDSSTVVALMQSESSRRVRTFTIGFDASGYNEAEHARAVAAHLGTDHTDLLVTPQQAMDVIPGLPSMYDEPFADSSQIPTFLVARLARQHVTVALSGDAGDELFGGYNRYVHTARLWKTLSRLPVPLRRAAAAAIQAVPPHHLNRVGAALPFSASKVRLGDMLHKAAGVLACPDVSAVYDRLISFWQGPGPVRGADGFSAGLVPPSGLGDVERMMLLDTLRYLPDDILVKADRAAMAASLETRMPFLDHTVFEYAWSLPLSQKIRNGQGKWVLRQVLYRHVPQGLIDRPKMGFAVPLDAWLRGPLRAWAEDLLSPARLRNDGLFDPPQIERVWQEHLSGRRNNAYHLWSVLMTQSWLAANPGWRLG